MVGTVVADDRETPKTALQDVLPLLTALDGQQEGRVRVYDPYYCSGGMKVVLAGMGFPDVHNEDVDCYAAWKKKEADGEEGGVPPFDVVVTNPPYSADHIRRAMMYCIRSKRPWAMLLPCNVFQRSWYQEVTKDQSVIFVAPHARYSFQVPGRGGEGTADTHTPLTTVWFVGGLTVATLKGMKSAFVAQNRHTGATLALKQAQLPRRIRKLLPYMANRVDKKTKAKKE